MRGLAATITATLACAPILLPAQNSFASLQALKANIEYSRPLANSSKSGRSGFTRIDIDGDGTNDLVVTGWKSNGNAHSFYVHSFYISDSDLNIVQIAKNLEPSRHYDFNIVTMPFDDEFVRSDLRFLKLKGFKSLMLLEAYRDTNRGYRVPGNAFFNLYQLEYDEISNSYSFTKIKTLKAAEMYVDINKAFQEIGIR